MQLLYLTLLLLQPACIVAGSLADIEHVVLFMQENRAFDHYFGTMKGVRGFSDPNVQVNSDKHNTFAQLTDKKKGRPKVLNPWYIAHEGGHWHKAAQCTKAGTNSWKANHGALNKDKNNHWVRENTARSWAHFRREDLPTHYSIADGWTVGDMYQESIVGSTNPNRYMWMSGSVNCPGGPQKPSQGGVVLENGSTPGCKKKGFNCFPLKWTTFPEHLQDGNITWQVYQDHNNFGENRLVGFEQFQHLHKSDPLSVHGLQFVGLKKFYDDAKKGKLPQVSWIMAPKELSEHKPFLPKDGGWLMKQVVDAVVNGAGYNKTALLLSYDETGGWGDHVVPFHSPSGTPGEWLDDPFGHFGHTYTGPGFRVPMMVVSPWTRGGHVFTEHADHTSQLQFLEEWLKAKGHKIQTQEISDWRRTHMSNLVSAFDFKNPDYSIPKLVAADEPSKDKHGKYDGSAKCVAKYNTPKPKVPYGKKNEHQNNAELSEEGFKQVRGYLTEGRYLVFEMNGFALAPSKGSDFAATPATADHRSVSQRWVLHGVKGSGVSGGHGAGTFTITSASTKAKREETQDALHDAKAAEYEITDLGNGAGYAIATGGQYLSISKDGKVTKSKSPAGFKVFSVTYKK